MSVEVRNHDSELVVDGYLFAEITAGGRIQFDGTTLWKAESIKAAIPFLAHAAEHKDFALEELDATTNSK